MNKGFIKIYRKVQDHWLYSNNEYLACWIKILLNVNHTDNKVLLGGKLFEVKKGQSLISLETWSDIFGKGWNKSKTRRFFELLKKDNMIETQNEQKTTRLIIINFDTYNTTRNDYETMSERKPTRKRNASETLATPNKNDKEVIKNEEEEENNTLPSDDALNKIFFEELKNKCSKLNLNYPDDIDKLKADEKCLVYIEYCHKYYGTKKQYKDYNGAARTFLAEVSKLRNYKKPESEVMSFVNLDDVISKICQSVDNCKPGNIHNYIKHKDQVGMFENWTFEQIYRHGCKVATYPDNQWQKEKKPVKVNIEGKKEIDKFLEGV